MFDSPGLSFVFLVSIPSPEYLGVIIYYRPTIGYWLFYYLERFNTSPQDFRAFRFLRCWCFLTSRIPAFLTHQNILPVRNL